MASVFEDVWDNPDEILFRSERHGVMAAVDIYPRLPYQCVVAPRYGMVDEEARWEDLPDQLSAKLNTVANAIGRRIRQYCLAEHRIVMHVEGWKDPHPHKIVARGIRGQSIDLHTGPNLGDEVARTTFEAIRFEPVETAALEARLDQFHT